MIFNDLPISAPVLRAIEELGFEKPTEIQYKAIGSIKEGRDVIGLSSTGTGKTAAFGIPVLEMAAKSKDKASVLILVPTRELAQQIADELRKFSKYLEGVSMATVYGGAPMQPQIAQLRSAKIVIGTAGRIMDHLKRKTLKLNNLKAVVLDEADEMLNMGFIEDIHTILETAPLERQTVLFSATMPAAIKKIVEDFQNDPVKITVKTGQKTAAGIEQSFYFIPQAAKIDALKLLIEYHKPSRALVFCNTKRMVDQLTENLNANGFRSSAIHGDLKQNQRTAVMNEFKSGRSKILIATDVAARGIDVDDIEAVFNYDLPLESEYYIHRIGRTGRAGKKGASYTLITNRNQLRQIKDLSRYIGTEISELSIPTIEDVNKLKITKFADDIKELIEAGPEHEWYRFAEVLDSEGYSYKHIAAALCQKLGNRSSKLKSVSNVAAAGKRPRQTNGSRGVIRASIGSDQNIGPNFIVGAIADATGLPSSVIGKINIFPEYTDIDVPIEELDFMLDALEGTRIKQQPVNFKKMDRMSSGGRDRDRRGGNRGGYRGDRNNRGGDRNRRGGDRGGYRGGDRNRRSGGDRSGKPKSYSDKNN